MWKRVWPCSPGVDYLVDLHSSHDPNDLDQACERGLRGQADGSVQVFTHKVGMVWHVAVEGQPVESWFIPYSVKCENCVKSTHNCVSLSTVCRTLGSGKVDSWWEIQHCFPQMIMFIFPKRGGRRKCNKRDKKRGTKRADGLWCFYSESNLWGTTGNSYLAWTPWSRCSGNTWNLTWKRHTFINCCRKYLTDGETKSLVLSDTVLRVLEVSSPFILLGSVTAALAQYSSGIRCSWHFQTRLEILTQLFFCKQNCSGAIFFGI